ncbi:hypothetical protein ALSL_1473 [Aerosticca soli]|uniref:Uncharacterized protein n=1 Tax=Aerosticca soli TaxID=2010829 RepID=A0A2Z6E4W1_9GAMM|nr:hypothetical protein ALSL_1473 [Aerosticca soli]
MHAIDRFDEGGHRAIHARGRSFVQAIAAIHPIAGVNARHGIGQAPAFAWRARRCQLMAWA